MWYRSCVSSTTRMLVLGCVKIFQPVHGYEVRRELISWHVEEWGSVAPGSIYNALKTLTKEGMIEVVGTKQVGGRPERTSYKITKRGDTELRELLNTMLWTVQTPVDPLIAVVSMMGFISRDEMINALEARAAQIRGQIQHSAYAIAAIDNVDKPAHVGEMMRLISARMGSELEWSKQFIERLRAGEYRTLGDPHAKEPATRKPSKPKAKPRKR